MSQFIPNFQDLIGNNKVDERLTIILFVLFFCCLMSSCISSSIAEKKLHGRISHTVLGLFLPLLYPAFIQIALPTKSKSKNLITIAPQKDEDDNLALMDLNEDYFKSIYLTPQGEFTGPYLIDMESNIVKAERITEVHPDFIVIETINNSGKNQRQRIPFAKMTSCVIMDEERYTPTSQARKDSDSSWLEAESPEMAEAISLAQKTFHQFRDEISLESRRIVPALDAAIIKVFFPLANDPTSGEHMFVDEIRIEGENIYGILTSSPQSSVDHVKQGDEVNFTLDRVSDWIYVIDGKGQGGHTLTLIMSQLSESELEEASKQPPLMWFV